MARPLSRAGALVAFVAFVPLVPPAAAQDPAPARPNVVLILVDDLGWTDLGCQGSKFYETPHIDKLAAGGMRFTNAYAACAVCSPTRAAVMTGRYPARTGVTDWIRARFQRGSVGTPAANPTEYVGGQRRKLLCPPNPYWLELDERTIAEALPEDYVSCHIGKWHLGDEAWFPQHQGFDVNHGGCDYGQPPSYFDPYSNRRLAGIPHLPGRKKGEYLTDREADEAVGFIRANKDRPFFLFLANYAVHTPIQAKREVTAKYAAKPKTNQRNAKYAAMVESVDDATGRVMAVLDELGLTERTLILFTSDNGGLRGPTHNAPLRSGKGYPYEGGIRVPLIVRWPGVVEPGRVSHEPVTSVDYFPTILEAVTGEKPASEDVDGVSLLSHLASGGAKRVGERALFWHFPHYRHRDVLPYGIVRDGDWKLIKRYEGPSYELFNLREDIGEKRDLAAAKPQVVARLDAKLGAFLKETGAKLPRPNPDYVAPERLLILGDSISIGYTPHVRRMLGNWDVVRPTRPNGRPENCAGTTHGVGRIAEWLAQDGGGWDVIHFNFGLHDLKRVHPETGRNSNDPKHPRQAEPDVYERQLRQIVAALVKTEAKLIFATTTPYPAGVRPRRDVADAARYNEIARRVMKEHGIAINDLYGFVLPRLGELQQPRNVHFKPAGSQALARRVAASVRASRR